MNTTDAAAVRPGDRVQVRDRPWRVRNRVPLADTVAALELHALDDDDPRTLTVVVPPDGISLLPPEELRFESSGFDAFTPWAQAHQLIAATSVRESGLLSGARFGRVELQAYQLAPALRLLSKPRASLLIADDVGLGKTIEAGLALLELMARGRAKRILVVTPAGLVFQWQEELLEKFGLRFTLIENAAGLARVQSELPAGTNPWDALPRLLTSIDFLKKDTVRNRALRKRWDLVVVDEAHALAESGTPQNPYRTQRTRLGMALRENARGVLLLTATPHNGYAHSFRSLIALVDPSGAALHGKPEDIARRVQSAMVRRMKAQIKRRTEEGTEVDVFPRRTVTGIPVSLDGQERELLRKVAAYCSRTARSAAGSDDADLVTFAMQIVKKRALSSRAALRQTIEHRLAALRKPEERESPPTTGEIRELQADLPLDEATAERTALRIVRSAVPKEEKRRKAEITALNGINRLLRSLPPRDPKIDRLVAELRAVVRADPTDKVIVFTEYLDTLNAIEEALAQVPELAGRTAVLRGGLGRRRLKVQQKFEEPDTRVLLCTDAASEGLNLQWQCHRVVHMELPWNPNRLEQRNGRVDRYGQTRPPQIRYLYYPDSPEDDVLDKLVGKIEHIQHDRVSTPDILGIIAGSGELEAGLVDLDPEAADVETRKQRLVRLYDDRTADFVRNVQPLVAPGDGHSEEQKRILDLLNTAEPLLPDDEALERLVTEVVGPAAMPADDPHVFRIEVPVRYRGPDVQAVYPRLTFRRSVAVHHKPDEMEIVTPAHPLVQSLAADARRRFLQVYPDERGLPPRRLAARRIPAGEAPSAVFTFLGTVAGGGGLLEEHLLAIRLSTKCEPVGPSAEALQLVKPCAAPGEVGQRTLSRLFAGPFDAMAMAAADLAHRHLHARADELRDHRGRQGAVLRADLDRDLADRLKEVDEQERRAKGLLDEDTGQARLFADGDRKGGGFEARRAAARAEAETRRREIVEFEAVEGPEPPRPLGALFLVPEGRE